MVRYRARFQMKSEDREEVFDEEERAREWVADWYLFVHPQAHLGEFRTQLLFGRCFVQSFSEGSICRHSEGHRDKETPVLFTWSVTPVT